MKLYSPRSFFSNNREIKFNFTCLRATLHQKESKPGLPPLRLQED